MGLLESLLNVPPELRAWKLSGVRYFLLPERSSDAPGEDFADPAAWPAPWPNFWAKCPPHPCIVLTYRQLVLDLSGHADKRRSALWRQLIRRLGWSGQQKIAFWPAGLDPETPPKSEALAIFTAGVRGLAPAGIAIFGEDAAAWLGLERTASEPTLAGVPCAILPAPERLLAPDAPGWDAVLDWFHRHETR